MNFPPTPFTALTVNEVVLRFPSALPVLTRYGIDSCCGGDRTIDDVIRRHRLDGVALLDELAMAIGEGLHPRTRL